MTVYGAIRREELEKLYWSEGLSMPEIANILKISYGKVRNSMNDYSIPIRSISQGIVQRLSRKDNPRLQPSNELAYCLGALIGDGGVYKDNGSYRIQLRVNDLVFANKFFQALESIDCKPCEFPNKSGQYVVQFHSRKFAEWYKDLSITDIYSLISVSEPNVCSFIRGLYESEGSNTYKSNYTVYVLYNTNKELVEIAQNILAELGFRSSYDKDNHREKACYGLRILGGQNQIMRLFEMIKPTIKVLELKECEACGRKCLGRYCSFSCCGKANMEKRWRRR